METVYNLVAEAREYKKYLQGCGLIEIDNYPCARHVVIERLDDEGKINRLDRQDTMSNAEVNDLIDMVYKAL